MELWRLVRKRLIVLVGAHLLGCFNLFSGFFELSDRAYMVNVLIITLWPIAFIFDTTFFVKRHEKRKLESLDT